MASKQLILVTGASGFVGAQTVDHLLKAGYAVRGTSRSNKADELRKGCTHPDFEVVVVEDLTTDDISQTLKGVHAVVHLASPIPTKQVDFVQIAVDATLNVLRQAHAAKIYKCVVLGSAFGMIESLDRLNDPTLTIRHTDWSHVTPEEARKLAANPFAVYSASKAIAERVAWEFADSHPEVDLTTILPPFVYGPIAPAHVIHNPHTTLSSPGFLYMLVGGPQATYPPAGVPKQFADVRDVARAIVASLPVGPIKGGGEKKRVILWGGSFRWSDAVRHLAAARPDLKPRMVDGGVVPDDVDTAPLEGARLDNSKAEEILGMTGLIGYEKCVVDTVDSVLKREAEWL